jgi:hypothetical protein
MDYKGKYKCKYDTFKNKLTDPKFRRYLDRITFVENMDFEELSKSTILQPLISIQTHHIGKQKTIILTMTLIEMTMKDWQMLLLKAQGKFALSYYHFDLLEEWFPRDEYVWEVKEFAKAASGTKGKKQNMGEELLIMNYDPNPKFKKFFEYK